MRLVVRLCTSVMIVLLAAPAWSQDQGMPMPMPMQMPMEGHDHHTSATPETPLGIDHARDASGTSWLPDSSPMLGLMSQRGSWMWMLHGNGFVQDIDAGGDRGDHQFGSINWLMVMAQRQAGGGPLTLRAMFSAEPLTVGRCGYPTLLATGESCEGEPIHDRQHPHDTFMELAVQYRRALSDRIALELYGGPAAEPALGPTAFPHRPSAMPNPIAPAAHHWLDSTHVSFGVATGGLYGRKWKAEASVFNGREPDDQRYDLDLDALDSWSGRVWLMPTPRLSLQVSAGHLTDAERDAHTGAATSVNRLTASMTVQSLVNSRVSATTIAFGQNRETHHTTSALLAEHAMDITRADTLFARVEVIEKTAAELVLPIDDEDPFTVSKLQVGYTRWLSERGRLKVGLGGSAGVSIVPARVRTFYGGRTATEASVFVTIRPQQ